MLDSEVKMEGNFEGPCLERYGKDSEASDYAFPFPLKTTSEQDESVIDHFKFHLTSHFVATRVVGFWRRRALVLTAHH